VSGPDARDASNPAHQAILNGKGLAALASTSLTEVCDDLDGWGAAKSASPDPYFPNEMKRKHTLGEVSTKVDEKGFEHSSNSTRFHNSSAYKEDTCVMLNDPYPLINATQTCLDDRLSNVITAVHLI
jgi:hypothetical protein